MEEPRIVERNNPEEVFTLLSDDTRVAILQALWGTDRPIAFSELREAVGVRDSGQFNYHLGKLIGQFVRKSTEGYELTQAGKGINGVIETGSFTLKATFEPIELDGACSYCGGVRTLNFENEVVNIECGSCEVMYRFVVPPAVFAGYDRESIPMVANRYLHATFHHIQTGFCWFCKGQTRSTVKFEEAPSKAADRASLKRDEPGEFSLVEAEIAGGEASKKTDDGESAGDDSVIPVVLYECERCSHMATSGLWLATFDHPAVRSFYYEQDIDIRDRPVWEFPSFDSNHLNVLRSNPPRVSVTYTAGDETLTLVLDEGADIVEVKS